MLNIEMALIVKLLLLWATPTVADVASEFARCELQAQLYLDNDTPCRL